MQAYTIKMHQNVPFLNEKFAFSGEWMPHADRTPDWGGDTPPHTLPHIVHPTLLELVMPLSQDLLQYSAVQQVSDTTFNDSISICLQLLTSVPHNHPLPTSVTSASSFFLLQIFPSFVFL